MFPATSSRCKGSGGPPKQAVQWLRLARAGVLCILLLRSGARWRGAIIMIVLAFSALSVLQSHQRLSTHGLDIRTHRGSLDIFSAFGGEEVKGNHKHQFEKGLAGRNLFGFNGLGKRLPVTLEGRETSSQPTEVDEKSSASNDGSIAGRGGHLGRSLEKERDGERSHKESSAKSGKEATVQGRGQREGDDGGWECESSQGTESRGGVSHGGSVEGTVGGGGQSESDRRRALIEREATGGKEGGNSSRETGQVKTDNCKERWLSRAAIGDGTCMITKIVEARVAHVATDCLPHGFCSRGVCRCVKALGGPDCRIPASHFGGLPVFAKGQFSLSSPHATHLRGVQYPMGTGPSGISFLSLPLNKAGPVNRRVWKALKKGELAGLEPVITPTLLNQMPKEDTLGHTHFNSCAVVGNSGLTLLYREGTAIDDNNAVFRISEGPTQSSHISDLAARVGSRTTIRIVDERHLAVKEGGELRLLHVQSKEGLYKMFQHVFDTADRRLVALDVDFAKYVAHVVSWTPSPTFVAVMLALHRCAEVRVYGVHWEVPGKARPQPYFAAEGEEEADSLAKPEEIGIIERLAADGALQLMQPCVTGCPAESSVPSKRCPLGSACVCGRRHLPPLALPGFCHVATNHGCFYNCTSLGVTCLGGPDNSLCPEEVLEAIEAGSIQCVGRSFRAPRTLPRWARKASRASHSAGGKEKVEETMAEGKGTEVRREAKKKEEQEGGGERVRAEGGEGENLEIRAREEEGEPGMKGERGEEDGRVRKEGGSERVEEESASGASAAEGEKGQANRDAVKGREKGEEVEGGGAGKQEQQNSKPGSSKKQPQDSRKTTTAQKTEGSLGNLLMEDGREQSANKSKGEVVAKGGLTLGGGNAAVKEGTKARSQAKGALDEASLRRELSRNLSGKAGPGNPKLAHPAEKDDKERQLPQRDVARVSERGEGKRDKDEVEVAGSRDRRIDHGKESAGGGETGAAAQAKTSEKGRSGAMQLAKNNGGIGLNVKGQSQRDMKTTPSAGSEVGKEEKMGVGKGGRTLEKSPAGKDGDSAKSDAEKGARGDVEKREKSDVEKLPQNGAQALLTNSRPSSPLGGRGAEVESKENKGLQKEGGRKGLDGTREKAGRQDQVVSAQKSKEENGDPALKTEGADGKLRVASKGTEEGNKVSPKGKAEGVQSSSRAPVGGAGKGTFKAGSNVNTSLKDTGGPVKDSQHAVDLASGGVSKKVEVRRKVGNGGSSSQVASG